VQAVLFVTGIRDALNRSRRTSNSTLEGRSGNWATLRAFWRTRLARSIGAPLRLRICCISVQVQIQSHFWLYAQASLSFRKRGLSVRANAAQARTSAVTLALRMAAGSSRRGIGRGLFMHQRGKLFSATSIASMLRARPPLQSTRVPV
jgi:hypothetical protein